MHACVYALVHLIFKAGSLTEPRAYGSSEGGKLTGFKGPPVSASSTMNTSMWCHTGFDVDTGDHNSSTHAHAEIILLPKPSPQPHRKYFIIKNKNNRQAWLYMGVRYRRIRSSRVSLVV